MMPDTLELLLSKLAKDQNILCGSEEAIKQGAILPILSQLGCIVSIYKKLHQSIQ